MDEMFKIHNAYFRLTQKFPADILLLGDGAIARIYFRVGECGVIKL